MVRQWRYLILFLVLAGSALPLGRAQAAPTPASIYLEKQNLKNNFIPSNWSGCYPGWDDTYNWWYQIGECDGLGNSRLKLTFTFPTDWDVSLKQVSSQGGFCYRGQSTIEILNNDGGTQTISQCTGNNVISNFNIPHVRSLTMYIICQCGVFRLDVQSLEMQFDYEILPPTAIGGTGTVADGTCKACEYKSTNDILQDAPNLVNYLGCQISNIYYCTVIPILLAILKSIVQLMTIVQSYILWTLDTGQRWVGWHIDSVLAVVRYQAGDLQNSATRIINAIVGSATTTIVQGGSSSNIWDALISLINGLTSVIGSIASTLTSLINGLRDVLLSIVPALRDVILSLINAIMDIVNLIFSIGIIIIDIGLMLIGIFLKLLGFIPLLFGSFFDGFASAPAMAPMAAGVAGRQFLMFNCDGDGFSVCLGVYVLDNTIFKMDQGAGQTIITLITILQAFGIFIMFLHIATVFSEAIAGKE